MATRVNYDDNLFYVTSVIRTLRSGLALELDVDFFQDKIVEDIFFVDRILEQIYEALRVNSFLINRKDHLHELMRAKRNFADLLNEILEESGPFAAHLAGFAPKLSEARERHVNDITDIQNAMDAPADTEDQQAIVSQDEYRFLLQNESGEE
jgi:hypothetical protein